MRELLLLSNSTAPGMRFLEHATGAIRAVLGDRAHLLFVPFASSDPDAYTRLMCQALAPAGIDVTSLHRAGDPAVAMADAEAVFVGGGNTFRLLRTLTTLGVLEPLRQAVVAGVPYLGASAGANLACPTIRTTNDMPIAEPPSLAALGLIPFQLNPHYLDPDPRSPHQGETRPARIEEFLEDNDVPVLGLREGAWLQVSGTRARLSGRNTGRLFRRHTGPIDIRLARTCPSCSTPAPASTSAPRVRRVRRSSRRPGCSVRVAGQPGHPLLASADGLNLAKGLASRAASRPPRRKWRAGRVVALGRGIHRNRLCVLPARHLWLLPGLPARR